MPYPTYVVGILTGTTFQTSNATTVNTETTTASASITSGNSNPIQVASAAGITVGQVVLDITNPSATLNGTGDTPTVMLYVTNVSGGNVTVNFPPDSGTWKWGVAEVPCCIASGDTLLFTDMIGFTPRLDYPDTSSQGLPTTAGTPWPDGTYVCLSNVNQLTEASPNDAQVGPFPFNANVTITEGECFIWTNVGSSGTQGTLTTLSTASPANTVVVPTDSGINGLMFGFIPNTLSCPAATFGEINQGVGDYQNPDARLAEERNIAALWHAITGSTQSATAVSKLNAYQTPFANVYNGTPNWAGDDHF